MKILFSSVLFLNALLITIGAPNKEPTIPITCQSNLNSTCSTINLNITTPNRILTTSGTVIKIIIENQTVLNFPRFDEVNFKNLILIKLTNSKLKVITQEDLKNLTELQHLDVSGNELSSLESKLFVFNKKLEFLDLSRNKIAQIHANTFDGLLYLNYLNLMNNSCVSVSIKGKISTTIKYARENCGTKNPLQDFIEDEKSLVLTIAVLFLAVITILQCCCCFCCYMKKKPNLPETLPSANRDTVENVVVTNPYVTRREVVNRPEPPSSPPPAVNDNFKSLPRRAKIAEYNLPQRPQTPNLQFTFPKQNESSLSPRTREAPKFPFNNSQSANQVNENDYMTIAQATSGGSGYMKMGDLKKKDEGYMDMGRAKIQDDGYINVARAKEQIDSGYLPMTRSLSNVNEKEGGYMDMKGSKKVIDGYLPMGNVKQLKEENPYEEFSYQPDYANFRRQNDEPVEYAEVTIVGEGNNVVMDNKKTKYANIKIK